MEIEPHPFGFGPCGRREVGELENRVGAVSHSAHRQHLHLPQDPHDKTGARAVRTDECRESVTISRSLTSPGCDGGAAFRPLQTARRACPDSRGERSRRRRPKSWPKSPPQIPLPDGTAARRQAVPFLSAAGRRRSGVPGMPPCSAPGGAADRRGRTLPAGGRLGADHHDHGNALPGRGRGHRDLHTDPQRRREGFGLGVDSALRAPRAPRGLGPPLVSRGISPQAPARSKCPCQRRKTTSTPKATRSCSEF